MSKLKIAVIGTGLVGTFHAEAFFRNPNSELVAVCDVDKEKVNSVAQLFNCKAYEDFTKLFKESCEEYEDEELFEILCDRDYLETDEWENSPILSTMLTIDEEFYNIGEEFAQFAYDILTTKKTSRIMLPG